MRCTRRESALRASRVLHMASFIDLTHQSRPLDPTFMAHGTGGTPTIRLLDVGDDLITSMVSQPIDMILFVALFISNDILVEQRNID